MFTANISYNFTHKFLVFLFLRTSQEHLICRLLSHNTAAPRRSSWDAK